MNWLGKLNDLKKKSKLTTEEISSLSGVPIGTLNKLFAGQTKDPQLSTIKAVVHALGYKLDDIDNEDPATISDDGIGKLDEYEIMLVKLVRSMTPDQKKVYFATLEAVLKSQGLI